MASRRPSTISVCVITGILLGLTLPPGLPLWMAALGGIDRRRSGQADIRRARFQRVQSRAGGTRVSASRFPVAITSYTPALAQGRFTEFIPSSLAWPLMKAAPLADWIAKVRVDAFSGATPLMQQKFEHVVPDLTPMILGQRAGSAGETSALLILLCGLYLIVRKMVDWRIPAAMLLSACSAGRGVPLRWSRRNIPIPCLFSARGGLMLGALFMATDPVGSPVTPRGVWIYGALME